MSAPDPELPHDVDTHAQASDADAIEEWVEEGGHLKDGDDETKP